MRHRFADCEIDVERHEFWHAGQAARLEPQVFDLIALLVANPGRLISRDELIEKIWKGQIVSESTVDARISAARRALGDDGVKQAVIETVPKKGIRLIAEVFPPEAEPVQAERNERQTVRYCNSSDGTQIAYAVSGEGPPLMRAGHFLTHLEKDWNSPVFGTHISALGADHTLIRYDQRGTGLSQTDIKTLSLEAYSNDMLAVADAAGLDRFPIFAASQGVPVSVDFAAKYPKRVSRLVFFGGFAQGRMVRDETYSRDDAEALMTLLKLGWGKPDSAFMSAFISMFCPEASREERASLVESQLASATPDMAARIRMEIDQFDVTERLADVRCPTLVIHASGDALHPVSQGRLLAAGIPGAEFKLIDSNNHIFLKSTPAWNEVITAAMDFFGR